jgi:PAS domain S-box-containing protein
MPLIQEVLQNRSLEANVLMSQLNRQNISQKEKIFLVDDNPDSLKSLANFLRESGFEVLVARSGKKAIESLEKASPDIILLAVAMQEMDGFETCRRLKNWEKTKDIPVIFMTAVADSHPSDKVKGLTLGAVDYISPPIHLEEVLARVKIHLQLHSLTKQLSEQNVRLQQEISDRVRETSPKIATATCRQQLELSLRESERRFRAIFNHTFEFMGLLTPKGTLIEANQTALDFGGIHHTDVAQKPLWEARWWTISPETQEQLKQAIATAAKGEFVRYEVDIRGAGDTVATIDFSLKPVLDETGNVVLLISEGRNITERKQAEERLRLLESVVVNSNDAVLITEAEPIHRSGPRIVYVNEAFTRMTGYRSEEVIGKTPRILQGAKTDRTQLDRIRQALETWQSLRVELLNYHKDGSEVWVELEIVPVANEQGWFTHWISIQRDITKRKQAELERETAKAALERQIQQALLLGEITQDIRSSLNSEQIFQTAATQIGQAFGVNRCLIHTYVEDPIPHIPLVAEYKQPGIEPAFSIEVPIIGNRHVELLLTQDKAIASPNVYTEPLLEEVFSLCHQLGLKSMLAVRTSYQGQPNGVIGFHQYDCFRQWTNEEIELLESVAAQVGIAIAQANLLEQEKQQRRELDRQNQQLQAEIRVRQQVEEALTKKAQELEMALGELKSTQSQLIQAEKMSSLGQLVAGVAHEINNPIGFISGNLFHASEYFQDLMRLLQIYQQTYPEPRPEIRKLASEIDLDFLVEDWQQLLNSMQVGTDRIHQLVRSLQLFSRLNTSDVKPVDIHEGIDNTLQILQHRLKAESVGAAGRDRVLRPSIEVIKDYGELPLVTCNASQLNQVFLNLLNNAIDALEPKPFQGVITIGTSVVSSQDSVVNGSEQRTTNNGQLATDWVVIRIADNGPGMSEDVQKKIFDPFFTTKAVGSGTGLGLSISYQIVVEKHQGQISCISAPGQGTQLIVEIPIRPKLS